MRAAITLALVGMLAGASTAQVGTWETEQDGEGLILHLGDDAVCRCPPRSPWAPTP